MHRVRDYLATDFTPTPGEFVHVLGGISGEIGGVRIAVEPASIGVQLTASEVEFDLAVRVSADKNDIPINLGTALDGLGLRFDASAVVDLAASLTFDFSFGFRLAPVLSVAEAFYFRPNSLGLEADVNATALEFAVNAGFFSAAVIGGSAVLHAGITAAFNDSDGTVTQGEMSGGDDATGEPMYVFQYAGDDGQEQLPIHDHRDNFSGGFAFATYHPGTSLPQQKFYT